MIQGLSDFIINSCSVDLVEILEEYINQIRYCLRSGSFDPVFKDVIVRMNGIYVSSE